MGVVVEIEPVTPLDVAAAVFNNAVAVAGDIKYRAEGIITGVGGQGARFGFCAAGRDADGFGLAGVASFGVNGLAQQIVFPVAADAAGAVGGGFDGDITPANHAVLWLKIVE